MSGGEFLFESRHLGRIVGLLLRTCQKLLQFGDLLLQHLESLFFLLVHQHDLHVQHDFHPQDDLNLLPAGQRLPNKSHGIAQNPETQRTGSAGASCKGAGTAAGLGSSDEDSRNTAPARPS